MSPMFSALPLVSLKCYGAISVVVLLPLVSYRNKHYYKCTRMNMTVVVVVITFATDWRG